MWCMEMNTDGYSMIKIVLLQNYKHCKIIYKSAFVKSDRHGKHNN